MELTKLKMSPGGALPGAQRALSSKSSTKRSRNVNHTGILLRGGDKLKYLHPIQKAENGAY